MMNLWNFFGFFLILLTLRLEVTAEIREMYKRECSLDPNVKCSVQAGQCHQGDVAENHPSAPANVRLSYLIKVVPHERPHSYHLVVSLDWQPPYDGTLRFVEGFELSIVAQGSSNHRCFVFVLDNNASQTMDSDLTQFRFATTNIFKFGRTYEVDLQSLPKSDGNFYSRTIKMPDHPEIQITRKALCQSCWNRQCCDSARLNVAANNCTDPKYAHPHASRWISAFRKVYVHKFARIMDVEFIGAPPYYCFSSYEVRLMRTGSLQILQHKIVNKSDLHAEEFENITAEYGSCTFYNLTPGNYDLAVVPLERDETGHCVCPRSEHRDHRMRCECTQTMWQGIKYEIGPTPAIPTICERSPQLPQCLNSTTTFKPTTSNSSWHGLFVFMLLLSFSLASVLFGGCVLMVIYRKYKSSDSKSTRVRFVQSRPVTETTPVIMNGNGYIAADKKYTVLVVYSHDCGPHEEAVNALANYISSNLNCNVLLDTWNLSEVAENKIDWAYKSVKQSDTVIVVHSTGAFYRYQAKLTEVKYVKRKDPQPLDDLFLIQLDYINEEIHKVGNSTKKFLSVHFRYTPIEHLMGQLLPEVRFRLPDHLDSLCEYLSSHEDNRHIPIGGSIDPLLNSINAMEMWIAKFPAWFQMLHVSWQASGPGRPVEIPEEPEECPMQNGDLRQPLLETPAKIPTSHMAMEDSGVVIDLENVPGGILS